MTGWVLAIDVGTTSTAAARRVGDRVETIQLKGAPRMPSLAFWREGTGGSSTGRLVLGVEAESLSSLAPWCLERTPKSRLGEEFILLGEKQIRPTEIIGAILQEVHGEALTLSGGEKPSEIRLTHPARWQRARLDRLAQAAAGAGLTDPVFVPEPVAAAVHFASERLGDGEHVAVYDLGGGTLDTAVLRREGDSFAVVGRTGGDEELGGEDFDDLLYRLLGDQLPAESWERMRRGDADQDRGWAQANREFLRQVQRAKEGLSTSEQYEFYLPPPVDRELAVSVGEFERIISPTLRLTVGELERTILAAGLQPADMAAVYLAGGSARIPLVARLIHERMEILPQHLDDPKAVVAMGAAKLNESAARAAAAFPSAAFDLSSGDGGEGPDAVAPAAEPPPPPPEIPHAPEPPPPPPPPPPPLEPQEEDPTELSSSTVAERVLREALVSTPRGEADPSASDAQPMEATRIEALERVCSGCGRALSSRSALCSGCGRLNRRKGLKLRPPGEEPSAVPARSAREERMAQAPENRKKCKLCSEPLDVGRSVCPSCGYLNIRRSRRSRRSRSKSE